MEALVIVLALYFVAGLLDRTRREEVQEEISVRTVRHPAEFELR